MICNATLNGLRCELEMDHAVSHQHTFSGAYSHDINYVPQIVTWPVLTFPLNNWVKGVGWVQTKEIVNLVK